MYVGVNETNSRNFATLAVKPFVVTMLCAMIGFSAIYLGFELWFQYAWVENIPPIGAKFRVWYLLENANSTPPMKLWGLPLGWTLIALSWIPNAFISPIVKRMT